MSGSNLLLDTNVVLYLVKGDKKFIEILSDKSIHISFITELELYSFRKLSGAEEKDISNFLSYCNVIDINAGIKTSTINIRQRYGIKLPDAIIAGTSLYLGIPLISADKAFNKITELDLIYYER